MHDNVFDRYEAHDSLLHRLDPRVKILVTVLFILSNVMLPDGVWLAFGLAWGFILLGNLLAELGPGFTLRRSLLALPFSLAAVTAIFSIPGHTLSTLHIGSLSLVVTETGLLRFASIMLRAWLSVQVAVLLVATTRFPDLIHALEHLYVPKTLVTIIAFLYRYLFILTDEVMRMLRARQSRSALIPNVHGGGSISWRAHVTGGMVGQLFLRSYERSDRIYQAMLARGYAGQMRTLYSHVLRRKDMIFMLLACLVVVMLQIIGRMP
jgi:cobalt/nickel transport system permease protein